MVRYYTPSNYVGKTLSYCINPNGSNLVDDWIDYEIISEESQGIWLTRKETAGPIYFSHYKIKAMTEKGLLIIHD